MLKYFEHLKALGVGGKLSDQSQRATQARNWYRDRYQSMLLQRNILALIAMIALGGATLSIYSMSRLTPLKSVEPFVIRVEDKTGMTTVVAPEDSQRIAADRSINNYFINKYINARESYSVYSETFNHTIVRLMSAPNVYYNDYLNYINPQNTSGMFGSGRLRKDDRRTVRINTLNYLENNRAQAFLKINEQTRTGDNEYSMIVTITFQYDAVGLTLEERYINPLGFRVVEYIMSDAIRN